MIMSVAANMGRGSAGRRLIGRERPPATERNKGIYVACCEMEGMTFSEALSAFERANRRLWAAACG